jgi:hypothetical protein
VDAETERQLNEELRPELESKKRQRRAHQRNRDGLQEQAARFGRKAVPIHIASEIEDVGATIRTLDAEIRELETRIIYLETTPAPETVLVIPDQAPHIPALAPALVDARLRAQDQMLAWMKEIIGSIRQDQALAHEETVAYRLAETQDRKEGTRLHQEQHRTIRYVVIGLVVLGSIIVIAIVVLFVQVF